MDNKHIPSPFLSLKVGDSAEANTLVKVVFGDEEAETEQEGLEEGVVAAAENNENVDQGSGDE